MMGAPLSVLDALRREHVMVADVVNLTRPVW